MVFAIVALRLCSHLDQKMLPLPINPFYRFFFIFFFLLLWKGGSIQAGDCSHMNSKLKQTGKCSSVSVKWMQSLYNQASISRNRQRNCLLPVEHVGSLAIQTVVGYVGYGVQVPLEKCSKTLLTRMNSKSCILLVKTNKQNHHMHTHTHKF